MDIDHSPQYVEDIFVISLFSIPVFCGIILVFAGDVLRRVYDVIINKIPPKLAFRTLWENIEE